MANAKCEGPPKIDDRVAVLSLFTRLPRQRESPDFVSKQLFKAGPVADAEFRQTLKY